MEGIGTWKGTELPWHAADDWSSQIDHEQWRTVRRFLNRHRHPLTRLAGELYPRSARVAGTPLLAPPGWIPDRVVPLAEVKVGWTTDVAPGEVNGTERETAALRASPPPAATPTPAPLQQGPQGPQGRPFATYAHALAALNPPRLLENRTTYRLVDLDPPVGGNPLRLTFAPGSYFDVINICEAAAHELAGAVLARLTDAGWAPPPGEIPGEIPGGSRAVLTPISWPDLPVRWSELPWRQLIGDPFDAGRRPLLPAISTLVLRRDPVSGQASFPLHWRDPAKVASGGGLYQVMPVGMFQPSADAAWNEMHDLDLWRATVRELSEELLGAGESYGTDIAPLDYESWPLYRALAQARAAGRLRVFWLGTGVDPLTLVVDMLQAAVFDADVFDTLFANLVTTNAEGQVIGTRSDGSGAVRGIPFTAETVERYAGTEPMQPAGAALLRLAWRHRDVLLNPVAVLNG
ncbi:transcriptional regulator [Frankia sp. Cr2]|uniref:transcriptional regulator n=1 Tax=Frankia sp. Cr2 TaxID=3073932 RepID=UPI002AD3943C|nr:transcriptional regulator [Frankia sp. Cr2]